LNPQKDTAQVILVQYRGFISSSSAYAICVKPLCYKTSRRKY